jgi:hypothetical protein
VDYWGDTAGDAGTVPPMEHPTGTHTTDVYYPDATMPGYPGREREVRSAPVEWSETEAGGTGNSWWGEAIGLDGVDWSVGGVAATRDVAYSSGGPVDPSTVENLELTGRVVRPGRDPEHASGPVGATEYRSALIMQIVQAMGPEVTDEMAAIGLLSGV